MAYYLSMVDLPVVALGDDNEILINCAYHFPGVLQTLPWKDLSPLFLFLVTQKDHRIRTPLAASYHEIARTVGPELAQSPLLLKVLHNLLQDDSQLLRMKIVNTLPKFISIFDPTEREYLIELLLTAQKAQTKWRSRAEIAKIVFHITQAVSQDTVFYFVAPMLFKMCSDQVAAVRIKAARNVNHLLEVFAVGSAERACIEDHICAFSQGKRFNQRQSFIWMCYKLLDEPNFERKYLPDLMDLCEDPVLLVRQTIVVMLDKYITKFGLDKKKIYLKQIMLFYSEHDSVEIRRVLDKYSSYLRDDRKRSGSNSSTNSRKSKDLKDIPEFVPSRKSTGD